MSLDRVIDDKKFTVGIVDISDAVKTTAVDRAEESLTADKSELKGWKGVAKKVFIHGLFREGIRQYRIVQSQKEIAESKQLFLDKKQNEQVIKTTIDRFLSDIDEAVHKEAGEIKEVGNDAVQNAVKDLVSDYATGIISEDEFTEGKTRIFSIVRGVDAEKNGLMYADSMLEVAKQIKELVSHGSAVDELMKDFQVVVGRAKMGVRTEAQFNVIDRITDKIINTRVGAWVPPEMLAGAVAIALSVGTKSLEGVAKSTVAKTASFGLSLAFTGLVTGAKESYRFEEERKKHSRDMAKGKQYDPSLMKRREELEQTRYETRPISDLITRLSDNLEALKNGDVSSDVLQSCIADLLEADARVLISDEKKIDLLSYSDEGSVESQRFQLDVLRAQVKVQLDKALSKKNYKNVLGYDTWAEYYGIAMSAIKSSVVSNEISRKNDLASKLKRKKVASAVAKGVLSGLVIGGVTQEIGAFFKADQQGFVEGLIRGKQSSLGAGEHTTPLEALRAWIADKSQVANLKETTFGGLKLRLPEGASIQQVAGGEFAVRDTSGHTLLDKIALDSNGNLTEQSKTLLKAQGASLSQLKNEVYSLEIQPSTLVNKMQTESINNVQFQIPEGMKLTSNPDGSLSLIGKGGKRIVEHLKLSPDGNLTPEGRSLLEKELGATITSSQEKTMQVVDIGRKSVVSLKEFVSSRVDMFHKVKRVMWFDNDTPGIFDKNELKLNWGGVKGSGLDENGNIVMDISRMMQEKSFHGGSVEDVKKVLRDGKMILALSASKDTQAQVVEVAFNDQGMAIIPKDSEIAKMFFHVTNGKASFVGKFAEVAQKVGQDDQGREKIRVFATAVGKGVQNNKFELNSVVQDVQEGSRTVWSVNIPAPKIENLVKRDVVSDILEYQNPEKTIDVDVPPIVPITWRTPLERMGIKDLDKDLDKDLGSGSVWSLNTELSAREKKAKRLLENQLSDTLRKDTEAQLDGFQEIEQYFKKMPVDYRMEIESIATLMGPMNSENRASICIPVAGHQEAKNIYTALENFIHQQVDKKSFELVLFVNAPKFDKDGKPLSMDETLQEIERFRKDYPDMNVRVMQTQFDTPQSIGFIRKMLTDVTLARQYERGRDVQDLIIMSNDADNSGIDPKYVRAFLEMFDKNPKLDCSLGKIDWDPEEYVVWPELHIGTRLMQYEAIITRGLSGINQSSGANFAYRASMYAAIGGYSDDKSGEDVVLGNMMRLARGMTRRSSKEKNNERFGYSPQSRVYTSTRRAIDRWKNYGLSPVEQWNKEFTAFDTLRTTPLHRDEIDYENPDDLNELRQNIETVINRTMKVLVGDADMNSDIVKKYLNQFLGISYRVDKDNKIVITDMTNLVRQLREYKEYAVRFRDKKSGKDIKDIFKYEIKNKEDLGVDELSSELDAFAKIEEKLTTIPVVDIDSLIVGKTPTTFGEYLLYEGAELGTGKDSQLVLAKKKSTGEWCVVKYVNATEVVEAAKVRNLPKVVGLGGGGDSERMLTPEKSLVGEVDESKIVLPQDTTIEGDRLARVYKLEGVDLGKILEKTTLSPKQAVSLMIRAIQGVAELHKKGVVHTDLQLSNFLINKDGEVKIGDLDSAYYDGGDWGVYFRNGVNWGNPEIMAPELFSKEAFFNKTADIYALGANLYRVVTGNWPFDVGIISDAEERKNAFEKMHKENLPDFPTGINEKLKEVILKAMAKKPSERYQNTAELMKDLLLAYATL